MRTIIYLAFLPAVFTLGCTQTPQPGGTSQPLIRIGGTFDPPPVRSYPAKSAQIQRWIDGQDQAAIRNHAWDIWESINRPAPNGRPIWENWHSGHELFDLAGNQTLEQRFAVRDFELPNQRLHAGVDRDRGIADSPGERPTSFNRYSPSLALFIYEKKFYSQPVLDSIQQDFDRHGTPIADRQIQTSLDSTDALSFALKPVFQFIYGDRPTAVPYWAGISAQTATNLANPEPDTWRQCVVVDPTGQLKPGATARMKCNDEAEQDWPVVALDHFFLIRITPAQADSFSQFAATSSDDLGRDDKSNTDSVNAMVKAGNIALLMAMHVAGKEINNWTWQTFWWSPDPTAPPFGHDRPASIPLPWSNYMMNTAYFMTIPDNTRRADPLITFNPYLETNLEGDLGPEVGSKDTIHWTGVISNCMSCHRMAAYGGEGIYVPNGYIDPGDPLLFSGKLKTDFLWSVPIRARK